MITAISARRSIRKYKSTPVRRELIEEVLQAGMLAPSSKNRQPWRFIVASGRAKEALLDAMRRRRIWGLAAFGFATPILLTVSFWPA